MATIAHSLLVLASNNIELFFLRGGQTEHYSGAVRYKDSFEVDVLPLAFRSDKRNAPYFTAASPLAIVCRLTLQNLRLSVS